MLTQMILKAVYKRKVNTVADWSFWIWRFIVNSPLAYPYWLRKNCFSQHFFQRLLYQYRTHGGLTIGTVYIT